MLNLELCDAVVSNSLDCILEIRGHFNMLVNIHVSVHHSYEFFIPENSEIFDTITVVNFPCKVVVADWFASKCTTHTTGNFVVIVIQIFTFIPRHLNLLLRLLRRNEADVTNSNFIRHC